MSRTPGERSRGGRSPRADRAGRIGGRARQIHWCRRLSFWLCQQATADSQMKPGTLMKLGRFSDIMVEQLMMSRYQHKPAASTKLHVTTLLLAPDLQSTRKSSSKLAMSSSSNAAVSETAARRTVERRSSHIRHGGRERRDRYLPPASRRAGEVFLGEGAGCPRGAPMASWGTTSARRFRGCRRRHRAALRRREPPFERYEPWAKGCLWAYAEPAGGPPDGWDFRPKGTASHFSRGPDLRLIDPEIRKS